MNTSNQIAEKLFIALVSVDGDYQSRTILWQAGGYLFHECHPDFMTQEAADTYAFRVAERYKRMKERAK